MQRVMKKFKIILLKKRKLIIFTKLLSLVLLSVLVLFFLHIKHQPSEISIDPGNRTIVIDPGHGGIDGGTNKDGVLEKEVNLDVAKKIKLILEQKGYQVIMTREEDISLDRLDNSDSSRHQKDLKARVNIINSSNAQFFLSIHVNSNFNKPSTDGAIVFYSSKLRQNKALAYCIQRSMNQMMVNDKKRTIHDPQQGNYYILNYAKIPGVLIETAFISNVEERQALAKDEFRQQLAKAIFYGVERYLNKPSKV